MSMTVPLLLCCTLFKDQVDSVLHCIAARQKNRLALQRTRHVTVRATGRRRNRPFVLTACPDKKEAANLEFRREDAAHRRAVAHFAIHRDFDVVVDCQIECLLMVHGASSCVDEQDITKVGNVCQQLNSRSSLRTILWLCHATTTLSLN